MATGAKIREQFIVDQNDVLTEQHVLPSVSAYETLTFARWIIAAQPDDLSDLERYYAGELIRLADELNANLQSPEEKSINRREIGLRFDAAHGAIFGVLDGFARLPVDAPQVQEARAVRDFLYEEGLGWLRGTQISKWGVSSAKLARIESTPGMTKRLVSLTSALAVATLEDVHLELGEAIGIGRNGQANDSADLTDLLRRFRNGLADYVRVMIGGVDRRDSASIARVERALEPIARFRKMVSANRPTANGNGTAPAIEPVKEPAPATNGSTSPAPSTP